jgi:hypothetical protein
MRGELVATSVTVEFPDEAVAVDDDDNSRYHPTVMLGVWVSFRGGGGWGQNRSYTFPRAGINERTSHQVSSCVAAAAVTWLNDDSHP